MKIKQKLLSLLQKSYLANKNKHAINILPHESDFYSFQASVKQNVISDKQFFYYIKKFQILLQKSKHYKL